MFKLKMIRPFPLILLVLLLAAACNPITDDSEPAADLTIPTPIVPAQEPDGQPDADAAPTQAAGLPIPPTFQPTDDTSAQPTAEPTSQPTPQATPTPSYQVAYVTADDTLNVRSGPGVSNGIIGELAPNTAGVQITGAGTVVYGSTWVPITAGSLNGWVNNRFLTGGADSSFFCQDQAVMDLVADLETAVANQDGDLLAQLVHPERGLRIRHAWWNPEIYLSAAEAQAIFTSPINHDWGIQDGSGNPIVGPFSQEILPLLQEDLLPAAETACDEILHGGTAGYVRLPDGYEQIRFVSLYRPGTEEFSGMDWGTWVAGIDRWQGTYYLSFLIHYAWEI